MKTTIYILTSLLLSAMQGNAQEETARRNQHFIDIMVGPVINVSSYKSPVGEIAFQGKNRFFGSLSLNYQYFFLKHWGAFADFYLNFASPYSPESVINKMETSYYPYQYTYNRSYDKEQGQMQQIFSTGIMYRKNIKSWSFRPHLGFGLVRYFSTNAIGYYRKEEGSNRIEEISVTFNNSNNDTRVGFCLSPGIYVSRSIGHGAYLMAGFSYIIHPRTFTGHYRRCNAYTHEILEQYDIKEKPGNYMNLKVGLSVRVSKK